jgi:hypothetical protein
MIFLIMNKIKKVKISKIIINQYNNKIHTIKSKIFEKI